MAWEMMPIVVDLRAGVGLFLLLMGLYFAMMWHARMVQS